jgi:hypothetical protein
MQRTMHGAANGNATHDSHSSHLEDLGAINPVADALANNLGGVHKVIQDGIVHLPIQVAEKPISKRGCIK